MYQGWGVSGAKTMVLASKTNEALNAQRVGALQRKLALFPQNCTTGNDQQCVCDKEPAQCCLCHRLREGEPRASLHKYQCVFNR